MNEETTYRIYSAWDELSPQAKKLVQYCYDNCIGSPLSLCRIMQQDATGSRLIALIEAERYLINE